ncbi:MAG: oxidoreductase [Dactylosporangium sp.]|jgi:NADP-dependent 3-hydroxy acid dehydrogenase YdfG|nr:oxidoreductase [Dactylosporangium sp.]
MRPLTIVTGASSGIGAAIAVEFSRAGYPLLLVARRGDRLAQLGLDRALCKAVDVTDRPAFEAAVAEAEAQYGPPDLLVNNAGVMPLGTISDQPAEEWRRAFDVNCLALLEATQIVLPGMVKRQRGTVVNVSSLAGRNIYANHMAYSGTKFAVHAMTENMRREHAADNIRFQLLSPGIVETELLQGTRSDAIKDSYTASKRSIGGGLAAESVARAVRYAYELPQDVCIREIVMAPTRQAS